MLFRLIAHDTFNNGFNHSLRVAQDAFPQPFQLTQRQLIGRSVHTSSSLTPTPTAVPVAVFNFTGQLLQDGLSTNTHMLHTGEKFKLECTLQASTHGVNLPRCKCMDVSCGYVTWIFNNIGQ